MENIQPLIIADEAYAEIVNLIKTFYLQGFEDAANCPEPVDMSDDIEKQLNTIGIQCNNSFWSQHLNDIIEYELYKYENEWDRCYEEDNYKGAEDIDDVLPSLNSLEYVLVSTSYDANETYIFPANANGEVTHWGEVGGLAERWGDKNWASSNLAMETVFGDKAKDFKIVKTMWGKGPQYLYQRTKGDE